MVIPQRVVMKVKWDHLCKMTGTQQIFGEGYKTHLLTPEPQKALNNDIANNNNTTIIK